MNAPSQENASADEPSVAGVRVRPVWPVLLFVLLVSSAALALYAQRSEGVDPLVARSAPFVFLAFAVGFAIYRLALVVARRYSAFKAFFQIFVAALFFMLLLLPGTPATNSRLPGLYGHRDPQVRALAAKVAGLEHDASARAALVELLDDPAPDVRAAAHTALVVLNAGVDLGTTPKAWKGPVP
jgi:HEAT repeat protein